jgi:hypothetical protein
MLLVSVMAPFILYSEPVFQEYPGCFTYHFEQNHDLIPGAHRVREREPSPPLLGALRIGPGGEMALYRNFCYKCPTINMANLLLFGYDRIYDSVVIFLAIRVKV